MYFFLYDIQSIIPYILTVWRKGGEGGEGNTPPPSVVLRLDFNSEKGAHVKRNKCLLFDLFKAFD